MSLMSRLLARLLNTTMLQPQSYTKPVDLPAKQKICQYYDHLAAKRAHYRAKNRYYYDALINYLQAIVSPGKKVLEIGCADGYVLEQLQPACGVGIDLSANMVKTARHRCRDRDNLTFFQADIEAVRFTESFDYILLSDTVGTLLDIQQALDNLRSACNDETRIIIHYHSILWEPILKVAERMGIKMSQPHHNWLTTTDIDHFLTLSDFERIRSQRCLLLPTYLPVLSYLANRWIAPLPGINRLCMANLFVLRKRKKQESASYSTTILIPCRNEKDNIRPAVQRIPDFGASQEIIFVDGHSSDGTLQEIEQVIAEHPERAIKCYTQPGMGKKDAVRYGFAQAGKDILMILDADLSVPPEDLMKFYDAIATGKGELINGSRLVYPMEQEAMRFLNILGNKFFSVALSWLLGQPLKDTLCGTKVLFRDAYQRIAANRDRLDEVDPFGDFELLFGAARLDLKILEVPIRYRERVYGSTNISRFRHGWLLLKITVFAFKMKML